MQRVCEVCQNFRQAEPPIQATEVVELGKRSIALCTTHAFILRWSRVSTLEGVRKLFSESSGKRSFVARRLGEEARDRFESERRSAGSGRRARDVYRSR